MSSNTAVEIPDASTLPPSGSHVVLRVLPVEIPPLTTADAEDPSRARVFHWNITGRDAGSWTPQGQQTRAGTQQLVFAVTSDDPAAGAHIAAALCQRWGWQAAEQTLSAEEATQLQSAGLPLPPRLAQLFNTPLRTGEDARDLAVFSTELWAFMDEAGRRDAFLTMQYVNKSPEEQKAAFLGALPGSMYVGPDASGNVTAACGARRTPGGVVVGEPCISGGPCKRTPSGICWRRWGLNPQEPAVEVDGEDFSLVEMVEPTAPVEVEVAPEPIEPVEPVEPEAKTVEPVEPVEPAPKKATSKKSTKKEPAPAEA